MQMANKKSRKSLDFNFKLDRISESLDRIKTVEKNNINLDEQTKLISQNFSLMLIVLIWMRQTIKD